MMMEIAGCIIPINANKHFVHTYDLRLQPFYCTRRKQSSKRTQTAPELDQTALERMFNVLGSASQPMLGVLTSALGPFKPGSTPFTLPTGDAPQMVANCNP